MRSLVVIVLAFSVAAGGGQEKRPKKQPNPFAQVKRGDRIEIHLKNKYTFTGWCLEFSEDRSKLTLNISHDYPDVEGSIVFKSRNVKRVKKLRPLSGSAREEMNRQIEEAQKRLEEAEKRRLRKDAKRREMLEEERTRRAEREATKAEEAKVKEASTKFYNAYPESAGWGQERYDSLKSYRFPTPEELIFVQNFQKWLEGKKYAAEGG